MNPNLTTEKSNLNQIQIDYRFYEKQIDINLISIPSKEYEYYNLIE